MKIHLRVVEFAATNENGERFFVEIGTKFTKMFWGFIPYRKILWKKNVKDNTDIVVGHKTIDEALEMCEELKKQIPKYHRIL